MEIGGFIGLAISALWGREVAGEIAPQRALRNFDQAAAARLWHDRFAFAWQDDQSTGAQLGQVFVELQDRR
jgi:hypothetical protein